jgi:hypothetical protein
MSDFQILLISLCSPEIFLMLGLIIPSTRPWVKNLIEDSDGDPHHKDGLFLMIIFLAKWCFCIAFILVYYTIVSDKTYTELILSFLTYGTALLGVRMFKNKLNLGIMKEEKQGLPQ